MKRVLFVISSLNTGGAQRAVSNIVTNLPNDWEIDILLNNAENITYPYRGNLVDLGIPEPSDRGNVTYQFKVLLKRFKALKRLKKTQSYDACISFLESANIVNILTGRKHCKTIVSVRTFISRSHSGSFILKCRNFVSRYLYNRANHVVALSKGVELDLTKNLRVLPDIASTIYNGFPIENIRIKAGLRVQSQIFTFITVGRCEQEKGQWHLIRAFSALSKKYGDCRLVVLGVGSYIDYLQKLIDEYGLCDKVILKGFVENPFAELVSADVFVFPSLFEGFGNTLLEAMVCGLPVIATDFRYGTREILAPDTDISFEQTSGVELAEFGIITPVCSGIKHSAQEPLEPQERFLLEAMELLYTDEPLHRSYSEASKRRAADFSIEKCVNEWRGLIEGA